MKKAFDQTIRDLKRGVNKKVLKVPSVEQKVLDATSNEPWGPHGSLLADIAQATRNYHEYQMIMAVLWKRLSDTGKNWRHVYKALTVLEYLVAHGSERVIDEIKEHAYQISTLSDFQYMDSSGRDQGNNVRRKSQTLVLLVNDKEKIQEVREKAASNRDKFRSTSMAGGMYRPGDDRYESQYDERNGNFRERDREGGYRDDEMYGRYGDSYSREGDRYGRESDEHYRRDRYGDDDSRGKARSVDGRSSDREDDDRHSARGSSVRGENQVDGRPIERKGSEQNLGMPPSYEEAVGVSQSPTYGDRDGETPASLAPQSSSPVGDATLTSSSPNIANLTQVTPEHDFPSKPNLESDGFDEFDPRAALPDPPVPTTSNAGEMDLLGSLSDAFFPSPLAIMPASNTSDVQPDFGNIASHSSFTAVSGNDFSSQPFEDPFGDSPFKAIPSDVAPPQPQNLTPPRSFNPSTIPSEHSQPTTQKVEPPNMEFSDTFSGLSFNPPTPNLQTPPIQPNMAQDNDDDILAGILPPSAPLHRAASVGAFPPSHSQVGHGFTTQVGLTSTPFSQTPPHSFSFSAPSAPSNPPHLTDKGPGGAPSHQNSDLMGDMFPRPHLHSSNSTGSLSLVSLEQPVKEKFEPKSAVWADTLSRGLVNLNISGPKINPLSDIGIDFDSLNRKEKRMEKPSATPTTSNVTMGKAMGSGSGMGRASVGGMRPPPNPMTGSGMSMGRYGSMNQQPMGMGMGMGMGMNNMNMGMGMTPNGSNQGPNMNYNPMMGRGGYPQPPYGGGYRSS